MEAERCDIRTSESDIVKMVGELDCLHFPTDVELFYPLVEVSDRRVGGIIRSENVGSLFGLIEGVDVLNSEDCQCLVVSGVEQSEAHVRFQPEGVNLRLRDVQGDGDGEQCAICESQVRDHAVPMLQLKGAIFWRQTDLS